jgi:hypothetical protein
MMIWLAIFSVSVGEDKSRVASRQARWSTCRMQELRTIVSEHSDQALSWCKSLVHTFEGDLIGFDKLGAHHDAPDLKIKPTAASLDTPVQCLLSRDICWSCCRKYFHTPARNTRASMGEPIPFNCKCFFSVVQSMLEARHVAVLMTISPRSATEAKRAAMFTVSPTAVMS